MLKHLVEYERNQAAQAQLEAAIPQGYQQVAIRWFIDLDKEGRLLNFVRAGDTKRGLRLAAPYRQTSSNIAPSLLVGSREYVLGIPKEARRQARADEAHRQFVELARRCAAESKEAALEAVLRFLEGLKAAELQLPRASSPEISSPFGLTECA